MYIGDGNYSTCSGRGVSAYLRWAGAAVAEQAAAQTLAGFARQRPRREMRVPHAPRDAARDQVRVILGAVSYQVAEAMLPCLS